MPGMYCIICGYDLSHSGSSRACSECGTPFDPEKLSTYAESPRLIHRVMMRAPHFRKWILEHHCSINCLCCGKRLQDGYEPAKCAGCGSRYDPRDVTTVLRALTIIPPALLRFQHIAPVRGVILPLLFFLYGCYSIIAQETVFIAFSRIPLSVGTFTMTEVTATLMGTGWIGAAIALNSTYFWDRVEPCWKWAPLGLYAGVGLMIIGFGGAIGYEIYHFTIA